MTRARRFVNPAPVEAEEARGPPQTRTPDQAPPDGAKRTRKLPQRSSGQRKSAARRLLKPDPGLPADPAHLAIAKAATPKEPVRRALTLGTAPAPPRGENCNIRNVLTASEGEQETEFATLLSAVADPNGSETLKSVAVVLSRLNKAFGDDERTAEGIGDGRVEDAAQAVGLA